MKFFKLTNLMKSYSVWFASLVTITPALNETTSLFDFIPEQCKPLAVTVLGLATLVARAIKQTKTTFSWDNTQSTKGYKDLTIRVENREFADKVQPASIQYG